MNICLLSREYPPETGGGGIGTHVRALSAGLAARKNTVVVVSSTLGENPTYSMENGVHLHRIPFPRGYGVLNLTVYALRVRRTVLTLISTYNIQVVEAPEYGAESIFLELFGCPPPVVVRLHAGTFIIHRMNGKYPIHPAAFLSAVLEWLAILFADAVTAPTSFMGEHCQKTLHLRLRNLKVLPNAVDTPPDSGTKHTSGPDKLVLFVGRLERLKSPDFLSRAIPGVITSHPAVKFVFIGLNTLHGPNRSSMQSYCESLIGPEHLDNVTFLGRQSRETVMDYLRKSDLMVLPSRFESFGIAYVEAMLFQLPVISIRGSAADEVVPHGVAGLSVDRNDVDGLREVILQLLTNDAQRMEMGRAGREHALSRFSPLVVAGAHEDFYRSLLTETGTGSHAT